MTTARNGSGAGNRSRVRTSESRSPGSYLRGKNENYTRSYLFWYWPLMMAGLLAVFWPLAAWRGPEAGIGWAVEAVWLPMLGAGARWTYVRYRKLTS